MILEPGHPIPQPELAVLSRCPSVGDNAVQLVLFDVGRSTTSLPGGSGSTHHLHFSWRKRLGHLESCIQQRPQIVNTIRNGSEDDDSDIVTPEILLVRQILIRRHEDIEEFGSSIQKLAILEPRPTTIEYRLDRRLG